MEDYLIEIIFKNINEDALTLFLETTTSRNNVKNYSTTTECREIDLTKRQSITLFLRQSEELGLFLNFETLKYEGFTLPKCGIAIYKSATTINMEINFQTSDLEKNQRKDLPEKLLAFAQSIATAYQIKNYYCGIEPAADQEGRVFTNGVLTPLSKVMF